MNKSLRTTGTGFKCVFLKNKSFDIVESPHESLPEWDCSSSNAVGGREEAKVREARL